MASFTEKEATSVIPVGFAVFSEFNILLKFR